MSECWWIHIMCVCGSPFWAACVSVKAFCFVFQLYRTESLWENTQNFTMTLDGFVPWFYLLLSIRQCLRTWNKLNHKGIKMVVSAKSGRHLWCQIERVRCQLVNTKMTPCAKLNQNWILILLLLLFRFVSYLPFFLLPPIVHMHAFYWIHGIIKSSVVFIK